MTKSISTGSKDRLGALGNALGDDGLKPLVERVADAGPVSGLEAESMEITDKPRPNHRTHRDEDVAAPVSGTIPFSRESGIYCESAFQQVTHLGPAWVTLGRKKDLTYAIPT